ncbi:hypothetical protein [Janthinobacterium fluminis]|uniref:Uncharacterized protein n=1 Tax=Janthinobacterium fluminis TaxID=2987524 RepID=A0ABT5JV94_9BURK|nr:hypothetical protein [Janthinobacterium fluminis]MDC8756411.1 hypothetical protein [Janthinobacterium fluminis]
MANQIDEVMGLCALCGPDNGQTRVLRQSHFLPKSVYRYLNLSKSENTKLLLRTSKKNRVFSMGKQIVQALLCDTCEGLMSVRGEDYYSKMMLRVDVKNKMPSPAYKILKESLMHLWKTPGNGYGPNMILSIGSNLFRAIDSRQLYHFVIGMFWKSTFDNWEHCSVMPLEASLIEGMRKFLLGGDSLAGYIVRIVPSFWREKHGVVFPGLLKRQPFFSIQQFDFYLENDERQFNRAISIDAVPLFYTIDSMRSESTFQGMSGIYKNAKQTKSAEETQLSWPAE